MLIMAAPNGARRTKADHPALPITIAETVATAAACHVAGADALHLHVRDRAGGHSLDCGLYRDALAALTEHVPHMRVQITTEAAGQFDVAAQFSVLRDLRPDWASVSLRETARDPGLARDLYDLCASQGTEVQHIVFDASDARRLADWQSKGTIGTDASVILVLGRYDTGPASRPEDVQPLRDSLESVGRWMVCAFGPREHDCLRAVAALGADVRVGFENAYVDARGQPWPDMPASIAAFRQSVLGPQPAFGDQ